MQKRPVMDLIIAEYLDGLRVQGVSDPPSQIPHSNATITRFFEVMMAFSLTYLHDDGAFLLFYPDNSTVKREVAGFFKNYKFKIKDEWTIINFLHLANPRNPSKNVSIHFKLSFMSLIQYLLHFH
jgi:hypothetical protein